MSIDERPNILFLHCHDLGRFAGCYGVPTVRTPNLDRLAAEGVRFSEAFSTAPHCSPSRAAMLTGRYPHATGVMGLTHRNFGWDLNDNERHLASLLGDAGYHCELIGVHHESRVGPDEQVAAKLGFDTVTAGGRAELVAERTAEALRTRASHSDQPFYLQVGFFEPHRTGPRTEGGRRTGFLGDYIEPDDSFGVTVPSYLADDESTRAEIAELQGAVAYMDAAVGRVLTTLDTVGLADRTIVVFTTDHGLALPRAKCTLYDAGLETALLMRAPIAGWNGGRTINGLVSNVDIVPTLLGAAGIPEPRNLHGRSMAPLLDRTGRPRDRIFGEFTFHDYYDPRRCVRTSRHKLIVNFETPPAHMLGVSQSWRPWSTPADPTTTGHSGPQEDNLELYDLLNDPGETVNLAAEPSYADVRDQLRRALVDWMRDTADPLLDGPVVSPAHHRAREYIEHGAVPPFTANL